jgi:hypothetical protein
MKPFALTYEAVRNSNDAKSFIETTLKDFGGIRFPPSIAKDLTGNLTILEECRWTDVLRECNTLRSAYSAELERQAAWLIQQTFAGFGPKQSRNLLQSLGLTRYEIPIDSRITSCLTISGSQSG